MNLSGIAWLAFTVVGCAAIAIGIHEAGHAIACALLAFRITGFTLFPVSVYRAEGSWKVTRAAKGAWGSVSCYPEGSKRLRARVFLMCAAGPLLSLAAGSACLRLIEPGAPALPDAAAAWLKVIGVLSVLFGISSLVPVSTPLARSDGLWMWTALVRVPRTEQRLAEWLLRASSYAGVRPRDWDAELVRRAVDCEEPTLGSRWVEYNWHADCGRAAEAAVPLEWWLEQPVPRQFQAVWRYEALWFEIFSRGDLAAARERHRAAQGFRNEAGAAVSIAKAEAALAAAEGRAGDAASAATEVEDALRRMPLDPGLAMAIRDDLQVLLSRYSITR